MKRLKTLFMTLTALLLFLPSLTFATGGTVETTGVQEVTTTSTQEPPMTGDDLLPVVTIEDANDWADEKGKDAVGFLTQIGQWFSYVVFIGGALLTLVGALSGKAGKGLVAMFFAVVMFAGITYAPIIIDSVSQWLGQ